MFATRTALRRKLKQEPMVTQKDETTKPYFNAKQKSTSQPPDTLLALFKRCVCVCMIHVLRCSRPSLSVWQSENNKLARNVMWS